MSAPVDVLAVMDPERQLDVRQSAKNANAGFVDWRDWCAYLGRSAEARAAVAELIEAAKYLHIVTAGLSGNVDANERAALAAALARVKGSAV